MSAARIQPHGEYAKNMYRCPAEWLRLVEARREGGEAARGSRAASEFLPKRLKRHLHVVEPRIDLEV
ncbi:MAG: hypothetical protein JW889_01645 [Verrucomicrobia bacterium]|nr:hypothetical protein [Verrucomicrobiota bacterium]